MKYKPLAAYTIKEAVGSKNLNLVWAKVFNDRYCVEVQHTGGHRGNLIVFDGINNFRVIHEEPVVINYDGKPLDPIDVTLWENIAGDVIENLNF